MDKGLDEILSKIKQNRMERLDQDKEILDARRRGRAITVTDLGSSHSWKAFCAS